MKNIKTDLYRRILIIDDNHLIHGDFHKIFATRDQTRSALESETNTLFGRNHPETNLIHFRVDSAYHGQEGAEKVREAVESNRPYAMAIVDMRMPLGWDGMETARQIWKIDPHIQVVICTAYSDFSWKEMLESIGTSDRLIILKKPFEPIEAIQLANMLTEKWVLQRRDRQKIEYMEQEISKRTEELQRTNQNLRRRNDEIQYFYHTLSHELKTPLTAAKEFIAIVTEGLAGELNETQIEYLDIAQESCSRLAIYIDDLFDAARLDTGKLTLDLKPVSLGDLVQQVTTIMRSAASEKNISLYEDLDIELAHMMIDKSRIVQVLTNLYNNALKFTPEGGSISVHLGKNEQDPDWVDISIADTGTGIPQEQIEYLFERFYQVDQSGPEQKKGVGLGLYLCRELLRLHGGSIRAESVLGNGSTFTFSLPITQLTVEQAAQANMQSPGLAADH